MADKSIQTGINVVGNVTTTNGDIIAGSNTTGGNTFYGRTYTINPVGLLQLNDVNGGVVTIFKMQADTQPATNLQFSIGATSPSVVYQSVSVSTGACTFVSPLTVTGSSGGLLIGQKTNSLGNCAVFQGLDNVGTLKGTVTINGNGVVMITNNSSQTNAISCNSGHVRADAFGQAAETNIGTVTTTATVNWQTGGASQRLTLTASTNCTVSFTAPVNIGWYTLKTISPATGVPAITWPATVKWAGGVKPVQAVTAGAANIQRFYYDGTNYWGDAIVNAT